MSGCVVFKTCKLHRTAAQWLLDGKVDEIRAHEDLLRAIAPRAWPRCTCGLWGCLESVLQDTPNAK